MPGINFQVRKFLLLFILFLQVQVGNSTESLKNKIESYYSLEYPERFQKVRDALRYGTYDSYLARSDSLIKYVEIEVIEIEKTNQHFHLLAEVKLDLAKFCFTTHREKVGPLLVDVANLLETHGDESSDWNEIRALSLAQQAHSYYWDYDYESGIKYQNDAIDYIKLAGNKKLLGQMYGRLGTMYSEKKSRDSSLVFFEKALQLGRETKDTQWYLRAEYLTAVEYKNLDNYDYSKKIFSRIMPELYEADHNNFGAAIGHIGDIELALENFNAAKFWLDSAAVVTNKGSSWNSKVNMAGKYVKYYTAIGDYKSAFQSKQDQYVAANNLNTELVKSKRIEQEAIFEKSLQEQKIAELELKNQISSAQLKNWIFGLLALFTLVFGGLSFFYYQQRQLQNQNILLASKELETQNVRQKLLTSITHELRTPLSVVIGKLQSLQQSNLKPADSMNINVAHESAQQLIEQINQLLEWNRAEAKAISLNTTVGNLKDTINQEIEKHKINVAHKKLKWDVLIDIENPTGYLDFEKFRTIFSNLISNATKYAPEKTLLGIEVNSTSDAVVASVVDQGPGIPANQLDKIFDWYYRVANSKDGNKYEGFGIGLALSKELAELMNGSITVQSKENQGSTFTLTLPFKSTSTIESQVSQEQNESAQLEGLTVEKPSAPTLLIIEDHEALSDHMLSLFSKKFEVHIATDFKSGEKMAKSLIPDCIISDIMLPDGSGLELCKILKKHLLTNHVPLILLTARTDEKTKFDGLKYRADYFLTKPFNNDELVLTVNNLIQNRRILKLRYDQPSRKADADQDPFIKLLEEVLEKNHDNADLSVDQFASKLNMSRGQFYRKTRATFDNTPTILLRNYRLSKAQRQLQTTALTISEVAYGCGFSSPEYFSTVYKSYFDRSPSEERNG